MNGASGGAKLKGSGPAGHGIRPYHLATMWQTIDPELLRLVVGPGAVVAVMWFALRCAGYRAIAWAAPLGLALHWYSWLGYGRDAVFLIALGVFGCAVVGAWIGHTSRVAHERARRSRANVALGTAWVPRPATSERKAQVTGRKIRQVPRALGDRTGDVDRIALERRPTEGGRGLTEAIEPPVAWTRGVATTAAARVDAPVFDIQTRRRQTDREPGHPIPQRADKGAVMERATLADDTEPETSASRTGTVTELELAIERHASALQRDSIVRDLAEGRESVDLLRTVGLRAPILGTQIGGALRATTTPDSTGRHPDSENRYGSNSGSDPGPGAQSNTESDATAARGLARTTRRGRWGSILTDGFILEFEGRAATDATVLAVLCEILDEDSLFSESGSRSTGGWSRGLPLAVVLVPTALEGVDMSDVVESGVDGDRAVWSSSGVFVPLIHLIGESEGVGRGLDIVGGGRERLGPI